MTIWLQVAVALMSIIGGGLGAYKQLRSRSQPHASTPHMGEKRPGLNGFTIILRQAMDQIDQLRRENEQLRIRVAELEAQAAAHSAARIQAKPRTTPPRRSKSVAVARGASHANS